MIKQKYMLIAMNNDRGLSLSIHDQLPQNIDNNEL